MMKGTLFCLGHACVYAAERRKNGPRSRACIYLGCDPDSNAVVVRDLNTRRVYSTADLVCVKTEFPYRVKVPRAVGSEEYKIPEHQFQDTEPVTEPEPGEERGDQDEERNGKTQDEEATEESGRPTRRRELSSQALRNIAHD